MTHILQTNFMNTKTEILYTETY